MTLHLPHQEVDPLVPSSTKSDESKHRRNSQLLSRKVSRWLYKDKKLAGGSLEDAFDYFEDHVLPRRMTATGKKAPPGTPTKLTELYNAWATPQREMADFGTGVAVYFETLRALVVICFLAWVLYLPSLLYYSSTNYDPLSQPSKLLLQGSIMCSTTEWVPCPTCNPDDWKPQRIATTTPPGQIFVLKNACASMQYWPQGLNHFIVFAFLLVAILALGHHQKRLRLQYDEEVLTAQDFSLSVYNPPADATDPNEWKAFFEQFGTVVYCTVALDNEDLIKALVKRRALLQAAGYQLRDFHDKDPLQEFPPSLRDQKPKLFGKFQKAQAKCEKLLQQQYDATDIFVTFETEKAQRNALMALTVAKMSVAANDVNALPPELRFRGDLVLDVTEADEPSVIRWEDLNETIPIRIMERVASNAITAGLIYLGFIAVQYAFQFDVSLAAVVIASLNIAVPNIFKLVNKLESHAGEGTYQASLYAKISIFRFVNTAVVTTIIKPFTSTLSDGSEALIPAVYAVLKAEMVIAPTLHMLDLAQHVKRHILAPRAENQAAMNSFFRGSKQDLGEKYTNMTKIIFLCFFYSVIFPSGFLLGALAIAATYITDKFLLFRSWAPMPELGDDVAKLSRRVFFPMCLVVLALMSEFYWSAYPFDNVCDADQIVSQDMSPEFLGTHIVSAGNAPLTTFSVNVSAQDKLYRFCDQDFLERLSALLAVFHMDRDDWMSPDQQVLTFLFGIACVGVLVVVVVVAFLRDLEPELRGVVSANFSTTERDSGERFSEQPNIQGYVPRVSHSSFMFPLLACDITSVRRRHIGWSDPLRDHAYYSLHRDVLFLLKKNQLTLTRPVLGLVQYFGQRLSDDDDKKHAEENKSATTAYKSV